MPLNTHALSAFVSTLLASAQLNASQGTYTVNPDGSADFTTIQAAIDAVSPQSIIFVAPGIYTSTGDEVIKLESSSVDIISLKGPERTFIHGEGLRRAFTITDPKQALTIQGFTFTECAAPWEDINGNGNVDSWEFFGGAMRLDNANAKANTPLIKECVFTNNSAEYGGAIYSSGTRYRVENCEFTGNGSPTCVGGAIYNNNSSPFIIYSNFTDNSGDFGGAILNWNQSEPLTLFSTFTNNTAGIDGGGVYNSESGASYLSCEFTGNHAQGDGGGAMNAAATSVEDNPRFTTCTFTENTCGQAGGAMHNFSCSPYMRNAEIQNNTASQGGGIYSWNSSTPDIVRSTICGNVGGQVEGNYEADEQTTIADICPVLCPADFNDDGVVDGNDVGLFFVEWGCSEPNSCPADLNQDGIVDGTDLGLLFVDWGPCN